MLSFTLALIVPAVVTGFGSTADDVVEKRDYFGFQPVNLPSFCETEDSIPPNAPCSTYNTSVLTEMHGTFKPNSFATAANYFVSGTPKKSADLGLFWCLVARMLFALIDMPNL
jgi:hypothetical protein